MDLNFLTITALGSFVGSLAAIIVFVKFMATRGFVRGEIYSVYKYFRDRYAADQETPDESV